MIKLHKSDRPMIRKLLGEGPLSFYAETVGFAFWKTIRTGAFLDHLPSDEAHAIIAHEEGHIRYWHIEKRFLWVITGLAFFRPRSFYFMCECQELEADDYAKSKGFGPSLASFLSRLPDIFVDGYPTKKERIERLKS